MVTVITVIFAPSEEVHRVQDAAASKIIERDTTNFETKIEPKI
jgi:hypothetical protein